MCRRLAALFALSVMACGGDDGGAPDAGPLPTVFGGDRPATLQVPADFDPAMDYPLLVILHGYSVNGVFQQSYLGLADAADGRGILVVAPEGSVDSGGRQFWNASDACCDFDGSGVDDVAYLGGLIEEIAAAYPVDPSRVHLIGHSNGGFMSFRLACERPDLIASIASLAGAASFADPTACTPDRPVSVLVLHGDADATVPYEGSALVPGARASATRWAGYDGCGEVLEPGGALDLDRGLDGAETRVERAPACPDGSGVELWTLEGAGHVPSFAQPTFADAVWGWLDAHRRP
jgi:polyhydroxybutyrate depolymerase